jgi:hypothetical protein
MVSGAGSRSGLGIGYGNASHLKAYLFSKFQNLISKICNLIFEPANLICYFQGHELFFDVEELKTEFGRLNFLISLLLLAQRELNFEFRKHNLNKFEFELGSTCKHAGKQPTTI